MRRGSRPRGGAALTRWLGAARGHDSSLCRPPAACLTARGRGAPPRAALQRQRTYKLAGEALRAARSPHSQALSPRRARLPKPRPANSAARALERSSSLDSAAHGLGPFAARAPPEALPRWAAAQEPVHRPARSLCTPSPRGLAVAGMSDDENFGPALGGSSGADDELSLPRATVQKLIAGASLGSPC